MNNENYVNNLTDAIKEVSVTVVQGRSKAGKDYEALKVVIGEYETLIFPTKFELKYIKSVL